MVLTLVRVTAAIAGVPVGVLMILLASGQAAAGPVLLGTAAVALAALGLAFVWTNDLRTLASLLHLAGTGERSPLPAPLSLGQEVLGEVQQISATLGEQSALVDRLLRVEESIVERLPDPLIVLSLDRTVRRTNAAARAAFGDDLPAVLRHPELRSAIDRAMTAGPRAAPQLADLRVPVPVPREVQAMVVALDSPLSGGGGVLCVLSDRTRERAVERMRADFVANASHELRTPLASLIGFVETLRGPAADDPPAQARFLEIMAEQAQRMNRLIDDLLSLSRIEITEHQPPAELVDLEGVVERILDSFEINIRKRGVSLKWEPAENLPRVLGDTDQLEQVAQNLLDNALKYGKPGGTVKVAVTQVSPGGKWPARQGIVLSVSDDGAGIPRQHLPRLTERFYRVDNGRSRALGGTGLGLAIVKHIINRHRGVLLIESEPGAGATFHVWLPTV
jgi:two-component system phosphate regulon sensor histidine kinase PhoR